MGGFQEICIDVELRTVTNGACTPPGPATMYQIASPAPLNIK